MALATTREGAANPRNYFSIAGKKANAETAVKVAGATATHCIVIHGVSTFLSGEGHNLDCDQECFTRANVAHSRATDLTILACPLNMQGMPGALQVLAALLHGVQTIHTHDNKEPTIRGSLDLTATAQATTVFQQALLPHPLWLGPLPVCLAEYHQGKVRPCVISSMAMQVMLRLTRSGWSQQMGSNQDVGDSFTTTLALGKGAA